MARVSFIFVVCGPCTMNSPYTYSVHEIMYHVISGIHDIDDIFQIVFSCDDFIIIILWKFASWLHSLIMSLRQLLTTYLESARHLNNYLNEKCNVPRYSAPRGVTYVDKLVFAASA